MASNAEKIVPSMARGTLREVLLLFLKVGTLAFGGAAGQIAMMRREVVERRRWISEQDFLDLFGISSARNIPRSIPAALKYHDHSIQ